MDDSVHLVAERRIFFVQTLHHELLVHTGGVSASLNEESLSFLHLLGSLIAVKREASACAFYDDARTETTKDAGLVVFCRIKLRENSVVGVGQNSRTCRTASLTSRRL